MVFITMNLKKEWFNKIDVEQRKEVTDLMFEVLYTTEVDTFEEIGKARYTANRRA